MNKGSKGSGSRRQRLPKAVYDELVKDTTKSCHKKKNGIAPAWKVTHSNGTTHVEPTQNYSRDGKGNIICGRCRIIITTEAADAAGVADIDIFCDSYNCCYDCYFRWYCSDCCFTFRQTENSRPFQTCGISLMKQLLDKDYNRGRYSNLTHDEIDCLREHFKKDIRYGLHPDTLCGKSVVMDKLMVER